MTGVDQVFHCVCVCVCVGGGGGGHKSIHLFFGLEYRMKYQDYFYTAWLFDMYLGMIQKYILLTENTTGLSV